MIRAMANNVRLQVSKQLEQSVKDVMAKEFVRLA